MKIDEVLEGCVRAGCVDNQRGNDATAILPTIAVPMAENAEIIRCIASIIERQLANFILIGNQDAIEETAYREGVAISGARFLPAGSSADACAAAARLASNQEAQILMKGLVQTAEFTRAVLSHEYGLLAPEALIGHVALFDIPSYHKLLLLTDAAINVAPDVSQKIRLAVSAAQVARSIGVAAPKIACIAPVEKVSRKVPSTVDAEEIRKRWESGSLDAVLGKASIAGPFGLDVAISKEAAAVKSIENPVAGDADILLMPNLESGNVLYKSLTCFARGKVAGVVAGARVPIVMTSRADSEQSKYLSVLLALALGRTLDPTQ